MLKFFLYLLSFNNFSNENLNKDIITLQNKKFNIETFFNQFISESNLFKYKDTPDVNEDLIAILFINILEFCLFLLVSLVVFNIKIVIFFTIIHVILILYNMFFYLKKYILHMSIILFIGFLLFVFGTENIFFLIFLMGIIRLFTIFLVFNKSFNLWKESYLN